MQERHSFDEHQLTWRERHWLRSALLGGWTLYRWVVLVPCWVCIAVGILLNVLSLPIWGASVLLGGSLAVLIGHFIMASMVLAAEERFLESLEFTVDGYYDVLSTKPRNGRLYVEIHYAEEEPSLNEVMTAVERVKGDFDSPTELVSPKISTFYRRSNQTNARYCSWIKWTISEVLLPLHIMYPISSIRIRK